MRARFYWPILSLLIALTGAPAAAQAGVPGLSGNARCDNVTLEADKDVVCTNERCTLSGNAVVACDTMRLWADTIELQLNPDRSFAGAAAHGNVMLVEANKVVTCNNMLIGADRIHARIDDAVIHVKKGNEVMPVSQVPVGRDQAVFAGAMMHRLSEDDLSIDDATFTLCDCGEGNAPSWEMTASRIDATLNDRVTIYSPMLWIHPFGMDLAVPITPPLAPISLPLKSRAPGFVTPSIGFYQFPYPTIDLPFFIPLGRSWDLTVTPGIRTDWSADHNLTPPSSWGAPRLGARARYAPLAGTHGELQVNWTWDRKEGMAILAERAACAANDISADECTPSELGYKYGGGSTEEGQLQAYERNFGPLRALHDRVDVTWQHVSDFSDQLRLVTNAEWLSDDLYLWDFGVSAINRNLLYLPSRGQLQWRSPGVAGSIGADYLLRIKERGQQDYSNLQDDEYQNPHRAAVRLHLAPTQLAAGLHADADLSLVRYGPWTSSTPLPPDDLSVEDKAHWLAPTQVRAGGATGLSYLQRFGPVSASARAGMEWIYLDPSDRTSLSATVALLSARIDTTLVRQFGDGIMHTMRPMLEYRALPWRTGDEMGEDTYFVDDTPLRDEPDPSDRHQEKRRLPLTSIDEQLRRDDVFHQALVGLSQSLWLDGRRTLTLDIAQPFDLGDAGRPFPTRVSLNWSYTRWLSGSLTASVYKPSEEEQQVLLQKDGKRRTIDLRELTTDLSIDFWGYASIWGTYVRYTPRNGRFLRTVDQIEAPTSAAMADGAWVHYASFGVTTQWPSSLRLSYQNSYSLPYHNQPAPPYYEVGFYQHSVGVTYRSPCDCWGLSMIARSPIPAQTTKDASDLGDWTYNVVFDFAGYRVGASSPQ